MKNSCPKILVAMKGDVGQDGYMNITALEYWRQLVPHKRLARTNPEIIIQYELIPAQDRQEGKPPLCNMTDEDLSTYDLVVFLRLVDHNGNTRSVLERCKRLAVKTIIDIDDYWMLDKTHHHYNNYQIGNIPKQTEEGLMGVDAVTTTTVAFADIIKEFNNNVTVLPNCISPDDPQFKPRTIESPRIRFGWIGGVFHSLDTYMMYNSFNHLIEFGNGITKEIQLCVGGFNLGHDNKQIIAEKKKQFKADEKAIARTVYLSPQKKNLATKGIDIYQTDYLQIEQIFTVNYSITSPPYNKYLKEYTPAMEHCSFDEPYRRLWAKDIWGYGDLYNSIDIAMIPLRDSRFNACKSELKIIEAGWMGKAAIVSDVMPYKPFLKHEHNCLAVNPGNPIDWSKAIRRLTTERNLRLDLAASLKQTITEHFDLDTHNRTRIDLYKSLIT